MSGHTRSETTAELSEVTLSKLRRECSLVASEVWVDAAHRVDFVGFRPMPYADSLSVAVERGEFVYVEVKSCMDDYRSGHGLCLLGDESWLVCPQELAEEVRYDHEKVGAARILSPDKAGRLRTVKLPCMPVTVRSLSAAELLWRMVSRSSHVYRTSMNVIGGDER